MNLKKNLESRRKKLQEELDTYNEKERKYHPHGKGQTPNMPLICRIGELKLILDLLQGKITLELDEKQKHFLIQLLRRDKKALREFPLQHLTLDEILGQLEEKDE